MTVETYRVSMWGYIVPIGYTGIFPQVSPVHIEEQHVKSLLSGQHETMGCPLLRNMYVVYSYQHVIRISHGKATQISFPLCGPTSD